MIINTAIAIAKMPNQRESFSGEIFSWRRIPRMSPTRAVPIATARKELSMTRFGLPRSPSEPISDLLAMMMREVAAACAMVSHSRSMSAGTIRNPPPAPTSPVMVPTTSHSRRVRAAFFHPTIRESGWRALFFLLHAMEQPAPSMMIPNMRSRRVPFSMSQIWSGMDGTRVCREK